MFGSLLLNVAWCLFEFWFVGVDCMKCPAVPKPPLNLHRKFSRIVFGVFLLDVAWTYYVTCHAVAMLFECRLMMFVWRGCCHAVSKTLGCMNLKPCPEKLNMIGCCCLHCMRSLFHWELTNQIISWPWIKRSVLLNERHIYKIATLTLVDSLNHAILFMFAPNIHQSSKIHF